MKDYEVLLEQNIWWKGKKKIQEDYDILRWKEKKINWEPKIIEKINLTPFSFHIIVGPRQVGKTTALKLLIKKILKKMDEKSIFYFNCEQIKDYKELIEVIETYLDIKEGAEIQSSYIILDEVTSVDEWQKCVKSLIDKGKFQNDILIVTGSMSLKIKKQAELFPGRRGNGENFLMLPLSFREFVEIQDKKLIEKIPKLNSLSKKELSMKISQVMPYFKELNKYLEKYFQFGGLPLSAAFLGNKAKKKRAKEAYLDSLKTDILEMGKNDGIAREVISSILTKIPSPISWNKISKEISVKSPKTVASYVRLMKEMYSIMVLNHVDISSKRLKYGKNKKIHVLDPLFLEVFEDWGLLSIKNKKELLAESCVATHLARFSGSGFEIGENIGYWKNDKEIDILVKNKKAVGFEVKWSDELKDVDKYKNYSQHLKYLIFILKNKYSNKPLSVPLSVFLALL